MISLLRLFAAKREKASVDQGIALAVIAREAIAEQLRYLEWKERAIAQGDADIAAGRLLSTEQVFAAVERQRAKSVHKAKKAAVTLPRILQNKVGDPARNSHARLTA